MEEGVDKALMAMIRDTCNQAHFPPIPLDKKTVINQGFIDRQVYNMQKHITTKKQPLRDRFNKVEKNIKGYAREN